MHPNLHPFLWPARKMGCPQATNNRPAGHVSTGLLVATIEWANVLTHKPGHTR